MSNISIGKCCLLALVFSSIAEATVYDDYSLAVEKRKALETKRGELESQVQALNSARTKLEKDFRECADPTWRSYFKPRIQEAEKLRSNLETQRGKLEGMRKELRNIRVALEERRIEMENKWQGRARGSDYETELSLYLEKLKATYFEPMEEDLFEGYREYIEGVTRYLEYVAESLRVCTSEDYTQIAIDNMDRAYATFTEIVKNITALKDILQLFSKASS
ncbi:MAG: hypothetical protein WC655_05895 [Candidatus Hydrogenedentales bacterium]|jgi:hypothetical protein